MKEIVIKIPDYLHERICKVKDFVNESYYVSQLDRADMYKAIKNGTELPKGHGKIGDVTELQKTFNNLCNAYGIDNLSFISDMDMNFDLMPNLVEADKENDK